MRPSVTFALALVLALVKLVLKPNAFDQAEITARAKGGNAVLPALP